MCECKLVCVCGHVYTCMCEYKRMLLIMTSFGDNKSVFIWYKDTTEAAL